MRIRRGRIGLIGPLLLLCGVALLLIAAQQRSATAPPSAASVSPQAIGTGVAQRAQATVAAPADQISDDLVSAAPVTTTTQAPAGSPPVRLSISSISLDQPIVEVQAQVETIAGQQVQLWNVADYAVGHHDTSADPGQGGNVVLAGHDDWHGEVFRDLNKIEQGAEVTVTTADGKRHNYVVSEILYRQEVGALLSERLKTGELIGPTTDEQLTLVTCWPYGVDDHRLIVIARPAS